MNGKFRACVKLTSDGRRFFLQDFIKPQYLKSQEIDCTGDFKSVVLKSRRESAHARTFGGDFELKILRMRGFSSRFWTMDLKSPVLRFYIILQKIPTSILAHA